MFETDRCWLPVTPKPTLSKILVTCAARAIGLLRDGVVALAPRRAMLTLRYRWMVRQCRLANLHERRAAAAYRQERDPALRRVLGNRHDLLYGEYLLLSARRRALRERLGIDDE